MTEGDCPGMCGPRPCPSAQGPAPHCLRTVGLSCKVSLSWEPTCTYLSVRRCHCGEASVRVPVGSAAGPGAGRAARQVSVPFFLLRGPAEDNLECPPQRRTLMPPSPRPLSDVRTISMPVTLGHCVLRLVGRRFLSKTFGEMNILMVRVSLMLMLKNTQWLEYRGVTGWCVTCGELVAVNSFPSEGSSGLPWRVLWSAVGGRLRRGRFGCTKYRRLHSVLW